MVSGVHCRGDDLAFFPSRRFFFPTTFVYICSENAVQIGGFYYIKCTYFAFNKVVVVVVVVAVFSIIQRCECNARCDWSFPMNYWSTDVWLTPRETCFLCFVQHGRCAVLKCLKIISD